jgi:hypothetical protein
MDVIRFETAVVARTESGEVAIALMSPLPPPFSEYKTCVRVLTCSRETFEAMCAGVPENNSDA